MSDLDEMTDTQFEKFKKKFLDKEELAKEDLRQIADSFDFYNPHVVRVACDEMHGHSYSCLVFSKRQTAVVCRLLEEIKRYRHKLDKIREQAKYK
jgi:hypothetical protein